MHSRRQLLAAALAALVAPVHRSMGAGSHTFDAIVSRHPSSHRGAAVFPTLAQALDYASQSTRTPFRILLRAGHWREKLVIERERVHLIGEGADRSFLEFDAAAGHLDPQGQPWGTFRCASLSVRAPGFRAQRLTIRNTFDYLGHLRRPQLEQIGPAGAQGVALMLDHGSDACLFEQVHFDGYQDTLLLEAGTAGFHDCRISGSVDFICGAGSAWFHDCTLRSRHRPEKPRQGYLVAPSTPQSRACGFVFERCRLERESAVPNASVALGRAWRPTRDFADGRYGDPQARGAACFLDCWMDAHIDPQAWDAMAYTARDGSRVLLPPEQARFGEYRSFGPGAVVNPQRPQLDEAAVRELRLRSGMTLQGHRGPAAASKLSRG